jgi:hypothetical protein
MKTTTAEYLELALKFEMLATFVKKSKTQGRLRTTVSGLPQAGGGRTEATGLKPPEAQ